MKRMILVALAVAGLTLGAADGGEGELDPPVNGNRPVWFFGGFNVANIHAGQHGVTGMARVVVNSSFASSRDFYRKLGYTNETDFISLAQMFYRFRIGNVFPKSLMGTDDWKVISMIPSGHDVFSTYKEIEIPERECDLEFFFVCTRRIPYYQYVDYTGLNIGVPGYTEEPPPVSTSRFSSESAVRLPSAGNDWFTRVRCGDSKVYSMRLLP